MERGDLVCFAPGPGGAHKLMNRSESPARTLMFSSSQVPAVSVYPDSDKIGVFPGNETDELIFRRGTAVPWYELLPMQAFRRHRLDRVRAYSRGGELR